MAAVAATLGGCILLEDFSDYRAEPASASSGNGAGNPGGSGGSGASAGGAGVGANAGEGGGGTGGSGGAPDLTFAVAFGALGAYTRVTDVRTRSDGTIVVAGVVRSDVSTGENTLFYQRGADRQELPTVVIGPQNTGARFSIFTAQLTADGALLAAHIAPRPPLLEPDFVVQPSESSEPSLPRAMLSHEPDGELLASIFEDDFTPNVKGFGIHPLSEDATPGPGESVVVNAAGQHLQPGGVAYDGARWAVAATAVGGGFPCAGTEITAGVAGVLAVFDDDAALDCVTFPVGNTAGDSAFLDVVPQPNGAWLLSAQSTSEFEILGAASDPCALNPGVYLAVIDPSNPCTARKLGELAPSHGSHASIATGGAGMVFVSAMVLQENRSAGVYLGRYQDGVLDGKDIGQAADEGARAIAARGSKGYIAGVSSGAFTQNSITLGTDGTSSDAFVVRYDVDTFLSEVDVIETGTALIGDGAQRAFAVDATDNGDVVFGGEYDTPVDELPDAPTPSAGELWGFVVRRALP